MWYFWSIYLRFVGERSEIDKIYGLLVSLVDLYDVVRIFFIYFFGKFEVLLES